MRIPSNSMSRRFRAGTRVATHWRGAAVQQFLVPVFLVLASLVCSDPALALAARRGPAAGPAVLGARVAGLKEYEVKGAFLYRFMLYTAWPESAFKSDKSPLEVVLLGKGAGIEDAAKMLEGQEVQGRSLRVRRAKSIDDAKGAHVVFAAGLKGPDLKQLIREFAERPALLVGDDAPFAQWGGTVNFFLDSGKVRFAINTKAADRSSLKISSQLLKLAKIVKEGSQ